jgi:hypothetical protein
MKIDESTMLVLEQCRIDNNKLFLPPTQLDRKLYEKVNKALEAMGGKWNRSAKAHLFPNNPSDLIEQTLGTGDVVNLKQELQYFPTPIGVINLMLDKLRLAGVEKGTVLEPSAGEGAIASRLRDVGFNVDVCEIHEPFRKKLALDGFKVLPESDFLKMKRCGQYDAVVANPPFTKQQDVDHVIHMLGMVKKGGMVVSVMSSGVIFRSNKKTCNFKKELEDKCSMGAEIERLPEGSFKISGTFVNTVLLTARVG